MWDKTHDSIVANFHMNGFRRRSNSNAFYSPSVDRFFAVDGLDPYTALEVAQILSSKMPGISVCILSPNDVVMTNTNCIEHTIEEKNLTVGPANILYGRQMPTLAKIPADTTIVKHVGLPKGDFADPAMWAQFLKFHEYAKFTIQCWHAIKLADAIQNILPMESYVHELLDAPSDMAIPPDSTNGLLDVSIKTHVKRILYTGNSPEEVLEKIKQMWIENNTAAILPYRRFFYNVLGITPPAEFDNAENVDRLTVGAL